MASPTDQVALCNRSLSQIGGKSQVSSISPSDGSTPADKCSLLFVPTFQALGRAAWWNCLQKQVTLSLLGAAPGTPEGGDDGVGILPSSPWLYCYGEPIDCLKARAIVPTFPAQGTGISVYATNNDAPLFIRGMGQIPFKVAYNTDAQGNPLTVILTNQSQAQLAYTVDQQNPVIWDTQFQAAFVAALAAYLVPALALNITLMNLQIGVADRIIAEARASDGNEGTNSQDHTPDWIRARSGGSGGWYDGWNGGGYENMSWPVMAP